MASIGIICAIPQERRAIVERFPDAARISLGVAAAWSFHAGGNRMTLLESGMGMDNAARATDLMLQVARPDFVLSAGFCGALRPGLQVGNLVCAAEIYTIECGVLASAPPPDKELTELLGHALADRGCAPGAFISVDIFNDKSSVLGLIPANIEKPVLEMETAAVSRLCQSVGTPMAALRAVSDQWDDDPAQLVAGLCDREMAVSATRVAATILRSPATLPKILRLGRNAHRAGNALGEAVARLLERL